MTRKTRTQKIKNFIKISVASVLVAAFIVCAFFVKYKHTFENSNMNKWLSLNNTQRITTLQRIPNFQFEKFNMNKWDSLNEAQRVTTVQRIVPGFQNYDLFMACMNKIAALPDSDNMTIQSAVALCYNGIKLNEAQQQ